MLSHLALALQSPNGLMTSLAPKERILASASGVSAREISRTLGFNNCATIATVKLTVSSLARLIMPVHQGCFIPAPSSTSECDAAQIS